MIFLRIGTLLLLLFSTLQLSAQEGARNVECRFLLFPPGEELDSLMVKTSEADSVTCTITSSAISEAVPCPVIGNRLHLYSEDKKIATAAIPKSATSVIVVLFKTPGAGNSGPEWKVVVIDDRKKNFPKGGAYVANLYSGDIRFLIGEHRGTLKPGGSYGYDMPAKRDDFNMAPVVVQFLHEGNWITANESALRFLPQVRYLVFAFVDPSSGRPRIVTFRDLKPLE